MFFMQTITGDEEEDKRVKDILQQADKAVITEVDALSFDHGGTRNQGAAMSEEELKEVIRRMKEDGFHY